MPDYVKPTHADSRVTIEPIPGQGLRIEYVRDYTVVGAPPGVREYGVIFEKALAADDVDLLKQMLDQLIKKMAELNSPPAAP